MKLEPPEDPPSEVQTACDVSQLYLDVRGLLRRHQGTGGSLGHEVRADDLPPCLSVGQTGRFLLHESQTQARTGSESVQAGVISNELLLGTKKKKGLFFPLQSA